MDKRFVSEKLRHHKLELKAQRLDHLLSVMDRMANEDAPVSMSPEQVAEALAALRAERCARRLSSCAWC